MRDKLQKWLGAEKEMGVWHYPRFTERCWGKLHSSESLCLLCRIRYPIKLLRIVYRLLRRSDDR